MKNYRKKIIIVQAVQWDETNKLRLALELLGMKPRGYAGNAATPELCAQLYIQTLEGIRRVRLGDWIIRNQFGHWLSLPPEEFTQMYELAPPEKL